MVLISGCMHHVIKVCDYSECSLLVLESCCVHHVIKGLDHFFPSVIWLCVWGRGGGCVQADSICSCCWQTEINWSPYKPNCGVLVNSYTNHLSGALTCQPSSPSQHCNKCAQSWVAIGFMFQSDLPPNLGLSGECLQLWLFH